LNKQKKKKKGEGLPRSADRNIPRCGARTEKKFKGVKATLPLPRTKEFLFGSRRNKKGERKKRTRIPKSGVRGLVFFDKNTNSGGGPRVSAPEKLLPFRRATKEEKLVGLTRGGGGRGDPSSFRGGRKMSAFLETLTHLVPKGRGREKKSMVSSRGEDIVTLVGNGDAQKRLSALRERGKGKNLFLMPARLLP